MSTRPASPSRTSGVGHALPPPPGGGGGGGGGVVGGAGGATRKLSDNAQARAALAARRRRREEQQQQQAMTGMTGGAAATTGTGTASSRHRTPSSTSNRGGRSSRGGGLGPDTTNTASNAADNASASASASGAAASSPMSTVKNLLSSLNSGLLQPGAEGGTTTGVGYGDATNAGIAGRGGGGSNAEEEEDAGGDGDGPSGGDGGEGYAIRRRMDLDRFTRSSSTGKGGRHEDEDGDDRDAAAGGAVDHGVEDDLDGSENWSAWSDNGDDDGDGGERGGGGGGGGTAASLAGAAAAEGSGKDSSTTQMMRTDNFAYLRRNEADSLDATCIAYGSSIVVRTMLTAEDSDDDSGGGGGGVASISAVDPSSSSSATSTTATTNSIKQHHPQRSKGRYCDATVVTDGTGVGMGDQQVLVLTRAYDSNDAIARAASGLLGGGATIAAEHVLRYGDFICLLSPYARNRSLGIRKARGASNGGGGGDGGGFGGGANDEGHHHNCHDIGFYRTVRGQGERWEVLPARGGDALIAVGSDAALAAAATSRGGGGGGGGREERRRRAVRSGDPLVLRNVQTGGLLSLGGPDTGTAMPLNGGGDGGRCLSIVTSSYQTTAGGGASTDNDRSLLDFLHHHDQVRPSPHETFRIIHAAVPSCPPWLVDSSQPGGEAQDAVVGARPYLDGTYLLHPGRDDDLPGGPIRSVFSPDGSASSSKQTHQHQPGEPLAKQPVQVQEQILLDEVLGSIMGLEGRYIRASSKCDRQSEMKEDTTSGSASGMQSFRFVLAPYSIAGGNVDASLHHIIDRILPLSSDFVIVNSFLSARLGKYEYGTVAHALAEAMDVLLQEYLAFATHMEALYMRPTTGLTLSKLFVLIQPSIRTMEVLRRVAEVASPLKGGALLNAVSSLMEDEFLGDAKAQDVLLHLLDGASVPYLSMLRGWLDSGSLTDSYGEFMIERAPESEQRQDVLVGNTSGDNWIHWFIVRDEHVLSSLSLTGRERGVAVDKVLTTGKYWNAIHLCGGSRVQQEASLNETKQDEDVQLVSADTKFTMNPIELSTYIDQSYKIASQKLRSLILGEYQLVETLRVMKRYFLLDQGDFFVHFLDMAEAELLKEMTDVSRGRIQSWLSMSVQPNGGMVRPSHSLQSLCMGRYMASSLQANFSAESLVDRLDDLHANSGGIRTQEARTPSRHLYGAMNRGLTGIEAFMLDFQYVPFPISLVLSHRAISSYQLLFRHLFFVKHVERRLVGTWLDHQSTKEFQSLRHFLGPTFGLRQRMLHFIQNLVYYMMFEVIEPNWQSMENSIVSGKDDLGFGFAGEEKDPTVDDVLTVHNEFLRRTLKECLLTNGDLIRTLTKLMTTCLLFSDQMKLFVETTQINEERDRIAMEERHKRQQNITIVSKRSRLRKTAKAEAAARKARWLEHTERLQRELNTQSYKRMISRFGQVFNNNLTDFMTQLRDSGDCSNLLARLDYNGYVSSSLKL